jgi:RNA polymerase sigma factor (sigma-70 family)
MEEVVENKDCGLTPKTRLTLIFRLAENDNRSWEDFYLAYSPLIRRFCYSKGIRNERTEDDRKTGGKQEEIIQEVMVRIWRKFSGGFVHDPGKKFRSYVLRITHNCIREHWREKKKSMRNDPLEEEHRDLPGKSDIGLRLESVEMIDYALTMLRQQVDDERHLHAFEMLLSGLSPEIVSIETGLTVSNLYVIKNRLTRKVRKLLPEGPK